MNQSSALPNSGHAGIATAAAAPVTSDDPVHCVVIIDDALPRWLAANTAAVLGVALGGHGLIEIGPGLPDAEGEHHPGIGTMPLPVLTAQREELSALRTKARELGLYVIDFNDAARQSRNYDEYKEKLSGKPVGYLGLALYGKKQAIRSIAGNLKSLR